MMRKKNNNMKHRGGGGRRYHGGGGGGHGGNRGGGEGGHQNIARQKHHALQMREKYSNMARDAQINGDRSDVEYYMQHVDHYNRVLADIGVIEAERQAQYREQQQQNTDQPSGEPPAEGDGSGAEEPQQYSGNQPRMTRHPRHHQQHRQDNQSQQNQTEPNPNENKAEIPLPGSVLPAI